MAYYYFLHNFQKMVTNVSLQVFVILLWVFCPIFIFSCEFWCIPLVVLNLPKSACNCKSMLFPYFLCFFFLSFCVILMFCSFSCFQSEKEISIAQEHRECMIRSNHHPHFTISRLNWGPNTWYLLLFTLKVIFNIFIYSHEVFLIKVISIELWPL